MKLNETFKILRINAGITQNKIADYLGVNRASYSNYETGKREPDISTLLKIADYFNVSLDEMFGRKSSEQKQVTPKERSFKSTIHKQIWDKVEKLQENDLYILDGYLDGMLERVMKENRKEKSIG